MLMLLTAADCFNDPVVSVLTISEFLAFAVRFMLYCTSDISLQELFVCRTLAAI